MKIRTILGVAGAALLMGFGVMPAASAAPTINAADDAVATMTSTSATEGTKTTKADKVIQFNAKSGTSEKGNAAASRSEVRPQGAVCYNGHTSGRNFYMICTSDAGGFYTYVDCTTNWVNVTRYYFTSPRYYGFMLITLTCPVGYYAYWGGWWV